MVLHPGCVPLSRGSLGIDLYRVFVVPSYASWKLDESDVSHSYYQPESSRHEYGVKIRLFTEFLEPAVLPPPPFHKKLQNT